MSEGGSRREPVFTKDENALLRGNWEEWKALHGGPTTPAFRQGLDDLLNLHGYSMTDVGLFLGISRERVRQYVVRLEITIDTPRAQHRAWDDEANRFVVVGGAAEYHKLQVSISGFRARKVGAGAKRQRVARWVLVDLGIDLGRVPCHVDLAEAYDIHPGRMNGLLGMYVYRGAIAVQCEKLWMSAGYDEYPNATIGGLGRPGMLHRTHDHLKTDEQIAERDRLHAVKTEVMQ